MTEAESEKYLGDVISKSGSLQETINHRKSKGDWFVTEIISILNEIPFGEHKVEIGVKLWEAMLINGILYKSERWHCITNAQIAILESGDEALLRSILQAQSKTSREFLHLETGTIPLRWIVAQRRIQYMKHILSRKDNEDKAYKVSWAKVTALPEYKSYYTNPQKNTHTAEITVCERD